MTYIIAIIGVFVGGLITAYSEKIYENFGPSDWAEQKLGAGGSRLFYKLVGIGIIFLSFFYMSGILQSIGSAIFSKLFNLKQ